MRGKAHSAHSTPPGHKPATRYCLVLHSKDGNVVRVDVNPDTLNTDSKPEFFEWEVPDNWKSQLLYADWDNIDFVTYEKI